MTNKPSLLPTNPAGHPLLKRSGAIECLESRIAPAAVVTPATFTYTDADGDSVQVQISGKTGEVEFLDAGGADVHVSGGDIAKIVITKPSADFAISFADLNAAMGDNIIKLGVVTGPDSGRLPTIKGIFTANSTPAVSYQLTGYVGTDFSAGGGLTIVGKVLGDGVTATPDLDLVSLSKQASVTLGDVASGATVRITGKSSGNLRAAALDGDLSIGSVVGLVEIGHIGGSFTVLKDVSGRVALGDLAAFPAETSETFTVSGGILKSGSIYTAADLILTVTKSIAGSVTTGASLDVTVGAGLTGANLIVGQDLTADVAGAVTGSSIVANNLITNGTTFRKGLATSTVVGGTGVNLAVIGSVVKSRISGGTGSMNGSVSLKVQGSQFLTGGDMILTTGSSIENSTILPDGRLDLTVGSPGQGIPGFTSVIGSNIGSGSTSATVNIGGGVVNSRFTAGTDLNLTVERSVTGAKAESANDLTLDIGRHALKSRFVAGSDADVTIGGQLANSALVVCNNLHAEVGKLGLPVPQGADLLAGVVASTLETSDGSLDVSVVGPVASSLFVSGQHATVKVADLTGELPVTHQIKLVALGTTTPAVRVMAPGDVTFTSTSTGSSSPQITAGQEVNVEVAGKFGGSVRAGTDLKLKAKSAGLGAAGLRVGGDLSLVVDGNLTAGPAPKTTTTTAAPPAAGSPAIFVKGNVKDFRVAGNFSAGVSVGGNFVAGTTTAAATVIGGTVSASSFLHVSGNLGSDDTAPELVFGKGFAGLIEVAGDLLGDLTFNGNVNRLTILGHIGPATPGSILGDGVADILVKGKLATFTAGSLFKRTTDNDGTFVDAANTTTGVLHADAGALVVGPFLVAVP